MGRWQASMLAQTSVQAVELSSDSFAANGSIFSNYVFQYGQNYYEMEMGANPSKKTIKEGKVRENTGFSKNMPCSLIYKSKIKSTWWLNEAVSAQLPVTGKSPDSHIFQGPDPKIYFFTTNRQEFKDLALYFLIWITELLPLNCSGKNPRLGLEHTLGRGLLCQISIQIYLFVFLSPVPESYIPTQYCHPTHSLSFLRSGQKFLLLCIVKGLIKDCWKLLCSLSQWLRSNGNSKCCIEDMLCCGLHRGLGVQIS